MRRALILTSLALITSATSLAAAPADQIRSRIAGYRALGAAFKSANDAIRSGDFRSARVQQAAGQIVVASRNQYQWFPAGSGPQSRIKTAARTEIWTSGNEFRAAQDAFARQASAFERAVKSGTDTVIRAEARKLGAQCKACHDKFRVPDD